MISKTIQLGEVLVFPGEQGEPASAWEIIGNSRLGSIRIRRSSNASEAKVMIADAEREGKRLTWMDR